MADASLTDQYFTALSSADGELASSLFAEHGVIDDYRGGHRAGRDAICDFIGTRPRLTLTLLSTVYANGPRLTVYGSLRHENASPRTVRFVFTAPGDQIEHLCNSVIEFVPDQFLSEPVEPARYPLGGTAVGT